MGMNEPAPKPGHKHEERDLNVNVVVLFLVSLVVVGIIVHFVAVGMFDYLASRPWNYPPPSPLAASREKYTGPRLLVHQARDLQDFRAAEDSELNSYGWVDRDHGIVRIPITRAIHLLAERGLPTNVVEQGVQP
jgi:hypothetical protein